MKCRSSDLQDYLFGPVYEAGSYCATQNTLAGADTEIIPRAITLCPASFQTTDPPSLTFLMPVQGKTSITSLVPQSGTFFHELFHLVWTRTHSGDAACTYAVAKKALVDLTDLVLYLRFPSKYSTRNPGPENEAQIFESR